MRSFAQLTSSDPAWPVVIDWVGASPHPVEMLPANPERAEACLVSLQVTDASVLGALVMNTGGVLIDHGWLRLLGSGNGAMIAIDEANGRSKGGPTPGPLLVGHDVIGGRFVINDGSLPGEPAEMVFWSPHELDWTPLEAGHSSFVHMACTERLGVFYGGTRWPGWESDISKVDGSHAISLYPPLFTVEGRDPAAASKSIVLWDELTRFHDEAARQLGSKGFDPPTS